MLLCWRLPYPFTGPGRGWLGSDGGGYLGRLVGVRRLSAGEDELVALRRRHGDGRGAETVRLDRVAIGIVVDHPGHETLLLFAVLGLVALAVEHHDPLLARVNEGHGRSDTGLQGDDHGGDAGAATENREGEKAKRGESGTHFNPPSGLRVSKNNETLKRSY